MDHTDNDKPDARKLTVTAADLLKEWTPERRAVAEGSYRRGCHQMAARSAPTLPIRRETFGRFVVRCGAETLAGKLRYTRKSEGNGMLLDYIRQRLKGAKP